VFERSIPPGFELPRHKAFFWINRLVAAGCQGSLIASIFNFLQKRPADILTCFLDAFGGLQSSVSSMRSYRLKQLFNYRSVETDPTDSNTSNGSYLHVVSATLVPVYVTRFGAVGYLHHPPAAATA
jgi:hypothetical protein